MMDESSSGVVESLDGHIDTTFTNLSLLYSSSHSELRVAQRYGRRFILKSLPQSYRDIPIYEAQLEKEFNISILMNHPNVVQTIGFESIPGLGNTIIMEYVDGFALNEWLGDNPSEQERFDVLLQLLDGVAYIHSHQVIHRDLKPRNILVTRNGQHVKVIDFGLSDTDSYTIFKQPAGTKRYVSPEQLQSGSYVDLRSDIYSIGVIISDMFPRKYGSVAKRCCEQDPSKRFASVAQLKESLGKSRYSWWLVSLLLLLVAVLVGVLFYLNENSQPEEPKIDVVDTEEGRSSSDSFDLVSSVEDRVILEREEKQIKDESKVKVLPSTKESARVDRFEMIRREHDSIIDQQKKKYEAVKRSAICSEEFYQKSSVVYSQFVLWFDRRLVSFDSNSPGPEIFSDMSFVNDRLYRETLVYGDSLPPLRRLYKDSMITEKEMDSVMLIIKNESELLEVLGDSFSYWNSRMVEWSDQRLKYLLGY